MPCLKLCDLIYHPTCFHFTSYHCLTWKAPRTGVRRLSIQHWEVSMAAKDNPGAKEGCRSPNDGRLVGIRYLMVTNLLLTQIWKETPLQEKWVGLLVRLWMSVMPWKLWIKNNKPCLHAFLVMILVRNLSQESPFARLPLSVVHRTLQHHVHFVQWSWKGRGKNSALGSRKS